MTNFTYPHVKVNTYANPHRLETGYVDDTTVLFVPFISKFGTANEIKKIYSLEEFQSEYGSLDYATQGQTALNIANWLTNGGTVYAYRIFNGNATTHTAKLYQNDVEEEFVVGGEAHGSSTTKYYREQSGGNFVAIKKDGAIYDSSSSQAADILYFRAKGTGDVGTSFSDDGSAENGIAAVRSAVYCEAKHLGDAYNSLSIKISRFNNNYVSLVVSLDGKQVESRQKIAYDKLISISDSSKYLANFYMPKRLFDKITSDSTGEKYSNFVIRVTTLSAKDTTTLDAAVRSFFTTNAATVLASRLETPIQLIFDAGFTKETKAAMARFIEPSGSAKVREDVILILDCKEAVVGSTGLYTGKKPNDVTTELENQYWSQNEGNIAVYAQSCLIEEGTYAGKDIWVTPTYFLSMLMPYNDALYGVQYPVAGLTRGKINGIKAIDENPTPQDKQDYFDARINYIEKDSRGSYFMSQRTHDQASSAGVETALSFLNNVRVKNQMVQELERLGREYLFEFNDATTLSNMSTALNKYVSTWVQNRTLSFANVVVSADEISNETVNVELNMQFTGTIEIININIEID